MQKKSKQPLALFAILLLLMQTVFTSIPAVAISNPLPFQVTMTTKGQPYVEGEYAATPVEVQVIMTTTDSAQVEYSQDAGANWQTLNVPQTMTVEEEGEHSLWFRLAGNDESRQQYTIHIAPKMPQTLQQTQTTTSDSAIIYVKVGGSGKIDGTSWDDAYDSLQSALDDAKVKSASSSNKVQIWLAAGTYKPTKQIIPPDESANNRFATFQMKNNVAIYGGFKGTEMDIAERELNETDETKKTILSGDIDNTPSDISGNAYHVFYHPDDLKLDATAILDSVTITGGNANGSEISSGGGMYNNSSSPSLTNVTFSANSARNGGGMYNSRNGSPSLTNVTFNANKARFNGGGMYNDSSNPSLTNVTFSANEVEYGGGMYNDSSNPSLTNVTFSANSAIYGAGMHNFRSSPSLTNVTFNANSAAKDGGGMYNNSSSNPNLTNVTFSANEASNGGGMYNYGFLFYISNPSLTNVMFSDNKAANSGGGMYNYGSNPSLTNVTISGNKSTGVKGAIYGGGGTIQNSIIVGNNNEPAIKGYSGTITNSLLDVDDNVEMKAKFHKTNTDIDLDTSYTPADIFIDPSNNDYRLRANSPAINRGDNNHYRSIEDAPDTDLAGKPRIQGGKIDLGALEAEKYTIVTPSIKTQPKDQTVNVGEPAELSVEAIDGVTLSYQWYRNATNANTGGVPIDGETNVTYTAPTTEAGATYYYVEVTNEDSNATGDKKITVPSKVAKVQVNALTNATPPSIDTQPVDQAINVGESVELRIAASGGVILSYQWYSNTTNSTSGGTPISGATNATYTVPTTAVGTTYYYVEVTNTDPSATGVQIATVSSKIAKVQVNALTNATPPSIDTQPVGKTVNVGESFELSVEASDGVTLSYQWYSNTTNSTSGGTPISGATSATYKVPTTAVGTTYYYVVVTNTDSSATGIKIATATSDVTRIQVNALTHATLPSIDTQPVDKTVNVGESFELSVEASGGVTLSYQWYSNITNANIGGTPISGATNTTYTAPTTSAGTTYYYVEVTNTDPSATGVQIAIVSSKVAKIQVNALTNATPPSIDTQPEDQTVNVGESAELNVVATGDGVLSYQWYSNETNSTSNGTLISGATTATYSAPTTIADTTYYYVEVTNEDPSAPGKKTATVKSHVAKVQVNALTNASQPNIDTQPKDKIVNVGETAELNVVATGDGTLSYQWYSNETNSTSNGTPISDATTDTYRAPTNKAGTTYYYVEVTNTDLNATGGQTAMVTSDVAKVLVKIAPPPTPGGGSNPTPSNNNNNDDSPPSKVKITLNTNGGTIIAPIDITYNTKVSDLPVPTRTGFRFDGWYQDEALTKPWSEDTLVRENISLYAKWTALPEEQLEPQTPEQPKPEQPKPPVTFTDTEQHWAKEMIEELATLGIIQGYEDGSFRPNNPISRMHVAALLSRAFSFETVRTPANFKDVSPTHPFYNKISILQQAGIIDGANGAFLPAENMTRAELAKVLVGVLGFTPEGKSTFTDVDPAHWSAGFIAVLEREEIALGDNGKFNPNAPVTRAEFVAFLSRILQMK
ncbi:S-layer homology domain-containing protein [Solibacillus sp. FSL K6-1523]|uniref:S-layer homology domain-containing protein n=1 Tax=Solibacillus sp. FSL K6-1523 TaxID=2921471 RepID=UPI0030FD1D72